MPDIAARPGDIYVTTAAGCSSAAFSSAAFYCSVHGTIPYIGRSNALLIQSFSAPGAAACDAKERMISDVLRREKEVAILFLADRGITWTRGLRFLPFGRDTHGA